MMRFLKPLALFPILILCVESAQAQMKDMPSQAEFDPLLESAENKLEDFEATLIEFRAEAAEISRDQLDKDLKSVRETRAKVQAAHSGASNKGINLQRLVGILASLDEVSLDALEWKSQAELSMCEDVIQHHDSSRYDKFAAEMTLNLERLRAVGAELLRPTLRAAGAADQIMLATAPASAQDEKPAH